MTADRRAALVQKVAEVIKQVALGYASVDAASTAALDLIRAEVLEEAMDAAYSPETQKYIAGNERDQDGLYPPGSPYDQGRYDARNAIRSLKGDKNGR